LIENSLVYPELDNEGRLLFDDMGHFEDFMLEIEELSLDEIQKLNEKNEFISSYLLKLQEEEKLQAEITEGIILDFKVSSILNQNNELAFKDGKIFQANHDYSFFVINESAMHEINEFRKKIESGELNLEYGTSMEYSSNLKVGSTVQEFETVETTAIQKEKERQSWTSTVRMEGNSKRFNIWIYKYIRALTKAEQKRSFWGGWKAVDVDFLNVRDDGNVAFWAPELFPPQWVPTTYNVSRTNDDEAKHQLDISFGWTGFGLRQVRGESIHTGTRNGVTLTFRTDFN
jgi:hypothetical protein